MKRIPILIVILTLFILVSCSTMNNVPKVKEVRYVRGIWHRVEEGQTLWRIAKTYSVSLETIKSANGIEDVLHISPGTWVFVPGAKKHLYVQGAFTSGNAESKDFTIHLPVKGEIIERFGKKKHDFNYGIDIKVLGPKYVTVSQRGTVIFSGFVRGYGPVVIVDHGNNFFSLYTRDIDPVVKEGQKIESKTIIAKAIRKRGTDFPIIHFELYYKGKPVNPLYYLQ